MSDLLSHFPLRYLAPAVMLIAWMTSTNAAEPIPVYVLVGQSNMQGHAHVRTLKHLSLSEETLPLHEKIVGTDGEPIRHDEIFIHSLSADGIRSGNLSTGFGATKEKIGPELSFGIRMRERSGGPILIIKAAWGGKSLHTDFRPPSAGKYEFSEKQIQQMRSRGKDVAAEKAKRDEASGHFYRLMLNHVRETLAKPESVLPAALAQRGCRLEGFVWFQGWNDMVDGGVYPTRDQPGGYAEYSRLMRMFISDVRKDLGANELPFVIGVLGVNGPTRLYSDREKRYVTVHQNFRDAMAEPAAGKSPVPNVFAVRTENAWDQQLAAAVGVRKQIQQWERRQKQNPGQQPDNPKPQLSEEQEALLEAGVSNAEYHYLGSSKILTSIGTAFADALPTAQ